MTRINALLRLVPPPAEPVEAVGSWPEVEAALGTRLPADYKCLVEEAQELCWLTDGDPDGWRTVVWNARASDYDAHDVGAVGFLSGWLSGEISTTVFHDARPGRSSFKPFRAPGC